MTPTKLLEPPETAVGRRRRRWRLAIYGAFSIGIAGMFVGSALGYDLTGALVYLVGVVIGGALGLYACTLGPVSIHDERTREIERRASYYTLAALAYGALAVFPVLFVLEAADRFEFGPALEVLLFALSGTFLLWGTIYVGLRWRS